MTKVFLCYRRDDTAGIAGRMFDRLSTSLGKEAIFWDMDTIPFGADFRTHISKSLAQCDVLLALMGERWLESQTDGARRIDDPNDYVRIEIEVALSLSIKVIPVLIGRTSMPIEQSLPTTLADLAYRNAATVDPGRGFHADLDKLLAAILPPSEVRPVSDRTEGQESEGYDLAVISRANPALFVFLLDQSGSMADAVGSAPNKSRAQAVAETINKMLMDMIIRCAKADRVADYYHVAVWGYGPSVKPAFEGALSDKQILTISEIADSPLRIEKRLRTDHDGNAAEISYAVWVEPASEGGAPMCKALRDAYRVVRDWIANGHEDAFPPIIFHLSSGDATDGDPRVPAKNLTRLKTRYGSVLLFNCCLSYVGGDPILYPDSDDAIPDEYAKILFEMSSRLTSQMRESLRQQGVQVGDRSRGFTYQSTFVDIMRLLSIGTRSASLR